MGDLARRGGGGAPAAPWTWPEVTIDGAGGGLDAAGAAYLRGRGFDPAALADQYHVFSAPEGGGVVIPYFDPLGRPIYWANRDITGQRRPKYVNAPGRHPLYVPGFACGGPRRVPVLVVVEGQLDAIRVHQAGYQCAALGGKSLPSYLREDLVDMAAMDVLVLLDADAWSAAMRLAAGLRDRVRTSVASPPRGKDPADMTVDEVREVLG